MTLTLPWPWLDDPKTQDNFETISLQWPTTNPRAVRGSVSALGVVTAGTGFTVTKGAAGLYTINFTTAFSGVPSVNVTAILANADCIIGVGAAGPTTTACPVQSYVVSLGVLTNQAFCFIAMA